MNISGKNEVNYVCISTRKTLTYIFCPQSQKETPLFASNQIVAKETHNFRVTKK